jgi:hypothetical protein
LAITSIFAVVNELDPFLPTVSNQSEDHSQELNDAELEKLLQAVVEEAKVVPSATNEEINLMESTGDQAGQKRRDNAWQICEENA